MGHFVEFWSIADVYDLDHMASRQGIGSFGILGTQEG
jgi:hypothetical protein